MIFFLSDADQELLRKNKTARRWAKAGAALFVGVWLFGGLTPYFAHKQAIGMTILFLSIACVQKYFWDIVQIDWRRADAIEHELKKQNEKNE